MEEITFFHLRVSVGGGTLALFHILCIILGNLATNTSDVEFL
jgi:hypothetical protein